MSSGRIFFVAERFERLRDEFFVRGYALDPGPRDPNEWDELAREYPPTGLLRMKGVRLADSADPESSFDPEITFSVEEHWTGEHVGGALTERGFYLAQYSYHAHYHGIDQRHDFDPVGHPEMPYHLHPPEGADREAGSAITPEEALDRFQRWIDDRPLS